MRKSKHEAADFIAVVKRAKLEIRGELEAQGKLYDCNPWQIMFMNLLLPDQGYSTDTKPTLFVVSVYAREFQVSPKDLSTPSSFICCVTRRLPSICKESCVNAGRQHEERLAKSLVRDMRSVSLINHQKPTTAFCFGRRQRTCILLV